MPWLSQEDAFAKPIGVYMLKVLVVDCRIFHPHAFWLLIFFPISNVYTFKSGMLEGVWKEYIWGPILSGPYTDGTWTPSMESLSQSCGSCCDSVQAGVASGNGWLPWVHANRVLNHCRRYPRRKIKVEIVQPPPGPDWPSASFQPPSLHFIPFLPNFCPHSPFPPCLLIYLLQRVVGGAL